MCVCVPCIEKFTMQLSMQILPTCHVDKYTVSVSLSLVFLAAEMHTHTYACRVCVAVCGCVRVCYCWRRCIVIVAIFQIKITIWLNLGEHNCTPALAWILRKIEIEKES